MSALDLLRRKAEATIDRRDDEDRKAAIRRETTRLKTLEHFREARAQKREDDAKLIAERSKAQRETLRQAFGKLGDRVDVNETYFIVELGGNRVVAFSGGADLVVRAREVRRLTRASTLGNIAGGSLATQLEQRNRQLVGVDPAADELAKLRAGR